MGIWWCGLWLRGGGLVKMASDCGYWTEGSDDKRVASVALGSSFRGGEGLE